MSSVTGISFQHSIYFVFIRARHALPLVFRLIGDVRLHGNRFTAGSRYIGYDLVRAFFAGGVIDDDRRISREERFNHR
jgi:hypothetical protein